MYSARSGFVLQADQALFLSVSVQFSFCVC